MERPTANGRARLGIAVAATLVATALAGVLVRDAWTRRLGAALRDGRGDCIINWLGARAWRAGIDVYSPAGLKWAGLSVFGHPPTTPLWYVPLTRYGIYDLTEIWGYVLIAALLVHLVVVAVELRAPLPLAAGLVAWALVMDTSWWAYHVSMVQLSEPIAFLYTLAWLALRRDRGVASGILLGLATTMKLYAGLVVLVLVLRRCWRGVAAAVAVYAAFAIAATWRFDFACWREYVPMLRATQAEWIPSPHNASVQGIVVRAWLATGVKRAAAVSNGALVGALLSIALVGALAWLASRARRAPVATGPAVDDSVDLPFALFTTASVWLNPVVWEHYDVTLLMPIAVLTATALRTRVRGWRIGGTAAALALAGLLAIDMYAKRNAPTAALRQWYVTANWLPWPLTLGLLGALLWRRRRAGDVAPPAAAC